MCTGSEDSDSAASDVESEPESAAGEKGGDKKRRRKNTGPDAMEMAEALVTRIAPLLGGDSKSSEAILEHLKSESLARKESEAERRKRREEDCPEGKAEIQFYDGKSLLDDGLNTINSGLRVKIRGPFGDPASWWTKAFCEEKVGPILGSAVYLRHILGSDRPNNKAIAKSHSAFSVLELKHFSCLNAGVTRNMDTDLSLGTEAESGEQYITSRVRWTDVSTMYDVVDAVLTRWVVSQLVRPWDYSWAAAFRAFHRARMFSEVCPTEKKQVELSKDYFKRMSEQNILNARAGKPPVTADEAWKIVHDTCARAYVSCDRLFAGKVYVAANKDLEEKYATLKKEVGALKQERDKLNGQLNRALRGQPAVRDTKPSQSGGGGGKGGAQQGKGGRGSKERAGSGRAGGGSGGSGQDKRPGLGWTRQQKLDGTCVTWNDGGQCDGNCGKLHKCNEEEADGRLCWGRHKRVDHK